MVIVVPSDVVDELAEGRARGVALPDPTALPWVSIHGVADTSLLRLAADLDRGECEGPRDSEAGRKSTRHSR